MDLEEINRHRRDMGLPEREAPPKMRREFTMEQYESLWTVTIRFQEGYKRDADKRCERYNKALRNNHNDWSYNILPGRNAPAGTMYEAWFIVGASKMQSFEEMLRLELIKEHNTAGLYDFSVKLFVSAC